MVIAIVADTIAIAAFAVIIIAVIIAAVMIVDIADCVNYCSVFDIVCT